MVSRAEGSRLAVVSTSESFNIQNLAPGDYSCIINLKPMNGINDIDAFLDTVNVRLTGDGIFLCNVETLEQRASRLRHKFTPVLYYLFVAVPDFLIRRVAPRLRLTRGLWNVDDAWRQCASLAGRGAGPSVPCRIRHQAGEVCGKYAVHQGTTQV